MENEINFKEIYLDVKDMKNEKFFKIDYDNQNLDNNIDYQNWKESMLQNYGKDAKLFRCLNDKILFFNKYIDSMSIFNYFQKCPICKKYICYFCSYSSNLKEEIIKCCYRRAIITLFIHDIPIYVKNEFNWTWDNFIFLIPGLNFFSIFIAINEYFLHELASKQSKQNKNGKLEVSDSLNNRLFLTFIALTGILIYIPLIIYNIFFIIFMLLISIPFEFYPIKYMLSLINGD